MADTRDSSYFLANWICPRKESPLMTSQSPRTSLLCQIPYVVPRRDGKLNFQEFSCQQVTVLILQTCLNGYNCKAVKQRMALHVTCRLRLRAYTLKRAHVNIV